MKNRPLSISRRLVERGLIACSLLFLMLAVESATAENKRLTGHVPAAISKLNLQPVGLPPATSRLNLAIGLPLHNKDLLTDLRNQIYDPTSPNYHRFFDPGPIDAKVWPDRTGISGGHPIC